MYLGKRGFIYSACGSFTKNWERIRKFKIVGDSWYFYQNELEITKNRKKLKNMKNCGVKSKAWLGQ